MNLVVKEIHKKNKDIIKGLIRKNRYNPYSNLGFYKDIDKLNNYYYELFFGSRTVKVLSAIHNNEMVGLLTFSVSRWDSKVFDMKMANLGYLTATGGYSAQFTIKKKLLTNAVKYLKAQRVKLASLRVDSNDFSSIHALESLGFRLMDNLSTYILRDISLRRKEFVAPKFEKWSTLIVPKLERWFRIEEISPEDVKKAGDLLANSGIQGHYSVDPTIPSSKVSQMYRRWLESKYKDLKRNDIFVAKRGDEVVGCFIFSFNSLLEKYTGLKSIHRGLTAVDPSASGCIVAFINAELKKRRDLDFAEFETQFYNYRMIDVIQKLGMRLIRCRYTFHKRL
jgi:RimJ/RimL family protein N-acetyltransferase